MRIFVPAILASAGLALLSGGTSGQGLPMVGTLIIGFAALFHFMIYEIRNSGVYYFYHNLGLSRSALWLGTVSWSLMVGLALFLWGISYT